MAVGPVYAHRFNDYFIYYGIGIITLVIVLQWFNWYYAQHIEGEYKRKVRIIVWIKDRLIFMMLIYITIVVWLSISQGI